MTAERNRAALLRAVSKFSPATLDEYLQLYAPDAMLHFLPAGLPQGREGARVFYGAFFAALQDVRLQVATLVCEGDYVACRFDVTAVHTAELMGVPGTGAPIAFSGVTIMRFAGGHCVERWSEAGLLAALLNAAGAAAAAR